MVVGHCSLDMKGDYWEDGAIASEGNGVDGDDDEELMKRSQPTSSLVLGTMWGDCGVRREGFACFKSRIGFVGRISCGVVRGLRMVCLGSPPFPLMDAIPAW